MLLIKIVYKHKCHCYNLLSEKIKYIIDLPLNITLLKDKRFNSVKSFNIHLADHDTVTFLILTCIS